jgi:hypothetical protein
MSQGREGKVVRKNKVRIEINREIYPKRNQRRNKN